MYDFSKSFVCRDLDTTLLSIAYCLHTTLDEIRAKCSYWGYQPKKIAEENNQFFKAQSKKIIETFSAEPIRIPEKVHFFYGIRTFEDQHFLENGLPRYALITPNEFSKIDQLAKENGCVKARNYGDETNRNWPFLEQRGPFGSLIYHASEEANGINLKKFCWYYRENVEDYEFYIDDQYFSVSEKVKDLYYRNTDKIIVEFWIKSSELPFEQILQSAIAYVCTSSSNARYEKCCNYPYIGDGTGIPPEQIVRIIKI